jgi:hypothetical protein
LALDARHDAGNEPARQTHFDDRDQCAVLFQDDTGLAQVVRVLQWGSIGSHQRRWMQFPRRRPIASLLAGLAPAGMAASLAAPDLGVTRMGTPRRSTQKLGQKLHAATSAPIWLSPSPQTASR